ncbi:MAG: gliding motility-associated C-terminal domain-containing protein [Flavobacteriales bacterium]|nr:gliding motility-associated C-terminal domain-containing protein [Flavobacteriales bacterium]
MSNSFLRTSGTLRSSVLAIGLMACAHEGIVAQSAVQLPTRGTRFWAGYLQNGFGAQSLKVHILSTAATSGTVSLPLGGWSTNFSVGANAVAVIDVPNSAENAGSGTVQDKGVLIQSQDSVNVFITSFQNYTQDLTQVLPESSLGTVYRVEGYHGLPNFNNLHKSELLVLATQDGTQVRITPKTNTASGQLAGVPFIVNLNAGQSYQLQGAQDFLDLTGTLVEATDQSGPCRPFVVMGGAMCASSPAGCMACDHIFEQSLPITAWGTRYFTAPVFGVTSSAYRIMAHQDNTSVSIAGAAPIILNAGQLHQVSGTNVPVCIQANLPVSVVQVLEGYSCAGNGDPSLVLLSPDDRVSTRASFHTPFSQQSMQHSASVVMPTAAVGQLTLDGVTVSPALFTPFAGCNERSHAKIPVSQGVHRLQAAAGFQAYMFGVAYGESYGASVHDIGAPYVQNDSTVCGATPVQLNCPIVLNNAQWVALSAPTTVIGTGLSILATPNTNESYTVTGELPVSGCPRSFTFNVGLPVPPGTNVTANGSASIQVCQYEPVQLALDPPADPNWFQFQWSPSSTLDNASISAPLASPTGTTWYRVDVISPSGCTGLTDSVLVQVVPGNIIDLSTSIVPSTVCLGNTAQLSSSVLRAIAHDDLNTVPGSMWTAVQGGTVSAACGSMEGNALYFNGNGQRYAQTIGLNTLGGGHLRFHLKIATGSAPCDDADPGEHVVLEYSTNNGFSWNNVATYGENSYPSFTAIDAIIPPAAQTANTMFRWKQMANSGAGQDNWSLDAVLIGRYDNGYAAYSWSQPGTLNNPGGPAPIATPTTSGWYVLTATDPVAGCAYSDSVFVQVEPAFNLSVTPDMTLCSVTGTQLQAAPSSGTGITYAWTPNNGTLSSTTIANPVAAPSATTTYNVTAQNAAGCTAAGQVTISVGQLFNLQVTSANTTLCQGQSAQLNATVTGGSGIDYAWTGSGLDNSAIANPVATPAQTTIYTCIATHSATGCQLVASITIVVNTGYTINAGTDQTVCSALGVQLNVQHNVPNASYSWSPAGNLNSASIQSPTITNDVTATYTVTVTDQQGCSVGDQVTITRAFAGVPATQSASACANTPPTLTAPASGVSYAWSTGATTLSIVPAQSGPHTVTITDAQGCQAITTFNVSLFALPVVNLGADISICGSMPQTLNAGNAGSTFLWSTGANAQTISAGTSNTYSVTVTNANNCSASDAINVQFNPLPVDALADVTTCISTPPSLDAGNPGSTYQWSTTATTQAITPSSSGTYTVTVTTPQQCSATFDADVTLAPAVNVSLGNDTSICQGQSLVLDAGTPGSVYAWSTGASSQTISVGLGSTYSVTVSNGYCSASDAIEVAVVPGPVDVLANSIHCVGESILLDAGNAGCNYLWSTNATDQSISVATSATYTVTITNPTGCSATFDANVSFIPPPSVDLGPDTVLCEGRILTIDAGNPGSTYQWSNGATTRTIAVGQPGSYSVTVSNGLCSRTDGISVHFNPSPVRMAVNEFHTCLDDEPKYVVIDAGNNGSRFDWSTGESTQVIMASAYGWYYVHITNAYDCAAQDSARVIEYCPATIFVPNTFTPNGDGVNDIFLPLGKSIATMHLMIFDRWGELLFESNDPAVGWDGSYAGEVVKNDMYVWRIEYKFYTDKDGELGFQQTQSGGVQVLR